MARNTLSRSLHDVGLAAWLGGTLADAVALNAASAHADSSHKAQVANAGWDRWTPVNVAAIGAHPDVPVDSATEPAAQTSPEIASAQKKLRILQWAVSALAGIVVVLGALAGEQQRPSEVQRGLRGRLKKLGSRRSLPGSADLAAAAKPTVNRPILRARHAAAAS